MKNLIPYSRQYIDSKDIKAVTNVLKSDFLTSGPEVNKFQNKINKFCKNNIRRIKRFVGDLQLSLLITHKVIT